METNNANQVPEPVNQELLLIEILENSRKTRKYMQWQLYITVALVVIPLLGALIMIPIIIRSIQSVYSGSVIQ